MLTQRQKQILDYITTFIEQKGYSPSLEEIKRHFKLNSVATIHEHIKILHSKGYLKKEPNKPRAVEPYSSRGNTVEMPLLGLIAAGEPIEAIETPEIIEVSQSLLSRGGEHYALKIKGDSMVEEGIFDGDTVIIRRQETAENGEKVIALINGSEATLKKIYREKNGFRLQPANSNMKPIFVKELIIQGKVVSIIRNFDELREKIVEKKIVEPRKSATTKKQDLQKYLNRIFLGDIRNLLKRLPNKSLDMVFGDPDYNVGIKYGEKTYTKNFDEYIAWYIELIKEALRVLKDDGNLFMMNYPKQNAHLRVKYLDKFYPLVNEYVWIYNTNVGHVPRRFTTAHRTILHVRKTKNNKFYKDNVALPYKNPTDKRILKNLANGSRGRMPYSWFYFDLVKNVSREKTYHACQIPQRLTEMLIKSCTMPNDIVLILFGGSGSELEMCKLLNRQYISAEIDPKYYEIITDRLKNGYIKEKYKLQLRSQKKEREYPLFSRGV